MKKREIKRNIIFLAIWTSLSLILIFCKKPVGFISDEILYKRIAYSIFHFQPAISTHYPILYPMLIQIGFFFKTDFYVAMLLINIAFKGCCLFFIYQLLKKVTDEERASFILIIIAFSPIYFCYSRVLFAENLACPLLIINLLYHEAYRKRLIDENISWGCRFYYCAIAALLSLGLYWTKYLMLVTLPIFCLFWCSIYFAQENIKLKIKIERFLLTAAIYTSIVLSCIFAYAIVYALRTTGSISVEALLSTMGFLTGSGPANNGYAIFVDWKWLYSYALYALLGASPIIAGMIIYTSHEQLKKNWKEVIWYFILILALIYISARHSTYVDYNEGWKMVNLCGRYVAYTTPLLAICWIRICDYKDKCSTNFTRKLVGIIIGCSIVWISYEILYVKSPGVVQSTSWLTGLRAADNAAFTNLGVWCCWIYCIGIIIIAFANQWGVVLCLMVMMLINSFFAVVTCEKWHKYDYDNAVMCQEFYKKHMEENIGVICTENTEQMILSGQKLFYDVNDIYEGIGILSISQLEEPLWFEGDEYYYLFPVSSSKVDREKYQQNFDLFEGSLNQPYVFLTWNSRRFEEVTMEVQVVSQNGKIQISCEDNDNLVFVKGNYILPMTRENGQVIVELMEEQVDTPIYIYDIGKLTVSKEFVR